MGHVVNLGNVAVMKHITKIAVLENSTSIWEYDPSRDDNHVLGGSLDVIAAIRTLAIKVRFKILSLASLNIYLIIIRSRHQDSVLRNSRTRKIDADFLWHWRSPSTVIFVGDLPLKCLTRPIRFARYFLSYLFYFYFMFSFYLSQSGYFYRLRMKYLALSPCYAVKIVLLNTYRGLPLSWQTLIGSESWMHATFSGCMVFFVDIWNNVNTFIY